MGNLFDVRRSARLEVTIQVGGGRVTEFLRENPPERNVHEKMAR